MSTVRFHDPRGQAKIAPTPYTLSTRLDEPITIGLVANGFPDSVRFLDHVEKALAQRLPAASFSRYDKRDASSVISKSMLADIRAECGAIVAAYGH